jgi:tripartite-type tricarboxylate transporter receptor subunit TctC
MKKLTGKILTLVTALAAAGILPGGEAHAQRSADNIRFIVPYAPGGAADQMARLVANDVSKTLATTVIVENKPGAGGGVAAEYVAKSAADGRTFFVGSNAPLVINTALYAKLSYNPEKDFVPVGGFGKSPLLLVTRRDLPVKNLAEIIALGKTAPGKLSMGSAGSGNITHLAGEYASGLMGFKVLHVPFQGSAPAITSMMGSNIDIMFDALPSCLQQAKSGRIKPIAIMDSKRLESLPNVPTLRELGYENLEASAWFGLVAPAKTSPDVITKMNKAINEALAKPDVQARFHDIGAVTMPGTPKDFGDFVKSEIRRWVPVVKISGAKAD